MKKRSILFAAAVVALILASNLHLAWGYFSTYTEASGRVRVQGRRIDTDIEENVFEWTKHVRITNSADGTPVYVRARAFCGSEYELVYDGQGNWTQGADGFYYYNDILEPGGKTPELLVKINNLPEHPEDGQQFNVVVIYESTPVRYDANGRPYADWGQVLQARERSAE